MGARANLLGDACGRVTQAVADFEMYERTRHTGVRCGDVATTVPRHNEIPDDMAEVIFKQLAPALGKRWWTK